MKREFLVENLKDLNKYLQKNSLSCKLYRYKDKNSYMYEFSNCSFVLEEYKSFKKLILISDKDIKLDKSVKSLKEISGDKRYSKEYLKLFGNPKSYEFDENKVFEKCDETGLSRLDLHFMEGMSSLKVARVILYRLNQIFILEYSKYQKSKIDFEVLENSHKKLKLAFKYSKEVFDKQTMKHIKDDFNDLYMLLNHQDTFERYVLNFQMFIYEKKFYSLEKNDKPIYFLKKRDELLELMN